MNDKIIEFPNDEQRLSTAADFVDAVERTLLAELVDQADAAMRHIQLVRWSAAHVEDWLGRDLDQVTIDELMRVDASTQLGVKAADRLQYGLRCLAVHARTYRRLHASEHRRLADVSRRYHFIQYLPL